MSDDAERRFRVWYALADLFLDTQPQPDDYAYIARTLKASGYDRAELRRMFEEDVGPAFIFNLYDIAGEWAGWSEEFVREQMSRKKPWPLPGQKRFLRRVVDEEWAKLEPLLD